MTTQQDAAQTHNAWVAALAAGTQHAINESAALQPRADASILAWLAWRAQQRS